MQWIFLTLAIACELVGTSALKATEGFSRPGPTALAIVGYVAAFYFLSLSLKTIPVGVAYAVWSGVGIVFITLIGWLLYGQRLNLPAITGICLIVAGVVVLNLFAKSLPHA
jgi:small multidrug resistance pump